MSTLIDSPLFKLKPDAGPRQYANVSNELEVVRGKRIIYRHIQVSTSLFHLMHYLKVPPRSSVTLYLDIVEGIAVFGMMIDGVEMHDLWEMHEGSLPEFLCR